MKKLIFTVILVGLVATLAWTFRIILADHVVGLQALVKPGELSHVHSFIENRCSSCHSPFKGVTPAKCIACHAGNEAVIGRQPTEFHVATANCQGCHMEHKGYSRRPTKMDHETLVDTSLEQVRKATRGDSDEYLFAERIKVYIESADGSSTSMVSMKENVLNCQSCHKNDDPHQGLLGHDCAACHTTKKWTVSGYRHPSVNSKDCAHCHQAPPSHYMNHFKMISKKVAGVHHAKVEHCYKCHQSTSWNDIKNAGWYKHH